MASLSHFLVLALILFFSELREGHSADNDVCSIGLQGQIQDQMAASYAGNPSNGIYIDTIHPATCDGIVSSITVRGTGVGFAMENYTAHVVFGRNNSENTEIQLTLDFEIPCTPIMDPRVLECSFENTDGGLLSVQVGDLMGLVLDTANCSPDNKCSVNPIVDEPGNFLLYTDNFSSSPAYSELVTRPDLSLNIEITLEQAPITTVSTSSELPTTNSGNFLEIGYVDETAPEESFLQTASGVYIIPQESEVEGRLDSVEACGTVSPAHTIDSVPSMVRFSLIQFRLNTFMRIRNVTVYLERKNGTGLLYCVRKNNLDWVVEIDDYFGVAIAEECTDDDVCPAQIILPTEGFHLLHGNITIIQEASNVDLITISSLELMDSIRVNMQLQIAEPDNTLLNVGIGIFFGIVLLIGLLITGIVLIVLCIKKKRNTRLLHVKPKTWTRPVQPIQVNRSGRLRRTQSRVLRNQTPKVPIQRVTSNHSDYSTIDSARYERTDLLESNMYETPFQLAESYEVPVFSPASQEQELKQQLFGLGVQEIPLDQLQFEEELGKGQFAKVYKALWDGTLNYDDSESIPISAHVAVKVMEDQSTVEDRVKFLQEAVLLGQFDDPNIVAIFGVITDTIKLMLVCELMDEDLRAHLARIRTCIESGQPTNEMQPVQPSELPGLLLSYCRKIASSFVYLGLKGFIHRDLAARNILVSKEGDCKLSDFGLSRELHDDAYYKSQGGLVPVKWTAPEAILYKRYSMKSDVWSYGILLYEMWSLGCKPYVNVSNMEVIRKVEKGYRLPPPPGCPRTIYDLMIKCTHPRAEVRPSFANILTSLQKPDYQLLKWAPEDIAASSEEARKLGSRMEEGEMLYKELQTTYIEGTVETFF